jgi:uncharacterized protein YdaU (DUF1376 family)
MRGLPYVPFFTSDWLASSARVDMTLAERAIYLDLLFHIWERGGAIPADESRLAKLAMATPTEFEATWPAVSKHFVTHPDQVGMITNQKMLAVIEKQASNSNAQSRNGRLGGVASGRSRNRKRSESEAETNHPEPELESESERKTEQTEQTCASDDARACASSSFQGKHPASTATGQQTEWFNQFWAAYWVKSSRKRAFEAFCRCVITEARFEEVLAAVQTQSKEMMSREPQRRPFAETWLTDERWTDEPATTITTLDDECWGK